MREQICKMNPEKRGHDACGIGAVVDRWGRPSRQTVEDALEIVEHLEHRAGKDASSQTGDGVGILLQICHPFFVAAAKEVGVDLAQAAPRGYGVGMFFFPQDPLRRGRCQKLLEILAQREGVDLLGWRPVPVAPEILGQRARSCMPAIWQGFFRRPEEAAGDLDFDRRLYVLRRTFEQSVSDTYVASLSCRTIVYKGMFLVDQLRRFYPDLRDARYTSAIALVHSRFSTNTEPSWARAHPNRVLLHNGEINTIQGNLSRMLAREETMASPLLAAHREKVLPVLDPSGSDSAMLDNPLEFLLFHGLDLPKAVMVTLPEPWSRNGEMPRAIRDMYHYYATMMEPWDGPAALLFSDGDLVGACLDRNGLRPLRYYELSDGRVVLASEVGVLDLSPSQVVCKARLGPGQMLVVDTRTGTLAGDRSLKEAYAAQHPYGEWLDRELHTLDKLPVPNHRVARHDQATRDKLYTVFGYTYEDVVGSILPMAQQGEEPILSMGADVPIAALAQLFLRCDKACQSGANLLILSDRGVDENHVAIPSLLAVAALEQHLIQTRKRTAVSVILESGEPRDVHQVAALLGYGARAVNPYLAHECIAELIDKGLLDKDFYAAVADYDRAILAGVVSVAAKMGISSLQSYQSAQCFEAVGLDGDLMARFFPNTSCQVGGVGLDAIEAAVTASHDRAFDPMDLSTDPAIDSGGIQKLRSGPRDESHLYDPVTILTLQRVVRTGRYDLFKAYSARVDAWNRRHTLRGRMEFDTAGRVSLPLSEVEPVEEIVRRFKTGAMSYGSISQEAHECLAVAMNTLGGKSNSGEGGEVPERFGTARNSAIKQVASGRFGVTSAYLVSAQEIQIKMAQGAKPGEGGHLPGSKAWPWIARTRCSTPGVSLTSPPPHHDIYSIEALAELIYDLKNANRSADISVKLVSQAGVGTVAAGVAKAGAQTILISGGDGGAGAADSLAEAVNETILRRGRGRGGRPQKRHLPRRPALGDRPGGGPAHPDSKRPAQPGEAGGRWETHDRAGRGGGLCPGGGGVRLCHSPLGGPGVPDTSGLQPGYLRCRHCHPRPCSAPGFSGEGGVCHGLYDLFGPGGSGDPGLVGPALPGGVGGPQGPAPGGGDARGAGCVPAAGPGPGPGGEPHPLPPEGPIPLPSGGHAGPPFAAASPGGEGPGGGGPHLPGPGLWHHAGLGGDPPFRGQPAGGYLPGGLPGRCGAVLRGLPAGRGHPGTPGGCQRLLWERPVRGQAHRLSSR